jgi:riboflavin-specific deaminase-like protein
MTQRSAELAVEGWFIAQAAREATDSIDPEQMHWFGLAQDGRLRPLGADDKGAVLHWRPSVGWQSLLADNDPRQDLLELYLPVSSATASRPIIVGHLGQSLDGFIATNSGDACFVTGPQNILHLHRLRALCDAVIVGARTVENDNPRLTTRLVSGTNPVRVVLDPHNRLAGSHHVFRDGDAKTLRVIGRSATRASNGSAPMRSDVLEVDYETRFDLPDLVNQLRARGFFRIFVEGGGVTVSSFLEADLLDRLHIAVAPLLIGEGRPAIRMAPRRLLKDCMKVQPRIYRTGEDVLFDCDLRAKTGGDVGCEERKSGAGEATRLL